MKSEDNVIKGVRYAVKIQNKHVVEIPRHVMLDGQGISQWFRPRGTPGAPSHEVGRLFNDVLLLCCGTSRLAFMTSEFSWK